MAGKEIILTSLISVLCFVACNDSNKTNSEGSLVDTFTSSKGENMKSYIAMFEIPATDITRAVRFYEALLDIKIEKIDVDGMQMGILPYEGQMVPGVIVQADGNKPSADGVTLYLNAGENLQVVLDRV